MPLQQTPQFKAVPDKIFEIPQPGIGGLNLSDLEFEQASSQSPYMMNMMYRNGVFGKRYGQEVYSVDGEEYVYPNDIYAITAYGGDIYAHSGKHIYRNRPVDGNDVSGDVPITISGVETTVKREYPETAGQFITYSQKLYYLCSDNFYEYDSDLEAFEPMEIYVPDLIGNCEPDGSFGDDVGTKFDNLNILSRNFSFLYNSDGTSTVYHVKEYDSDPGYIKWDGDIKVYVDDIEMTTGWTADGNAGTITFTSAPAAGNLNVKFTFTLKNNILSKERNQLLGCQYYDTYGNANNSRLFLAGCGNSKYFWSAAYDISYYPDDNWATLGNTEEDITGFGRQYNILIVFKPREIYAISSFTYSTSTTIVEDKLGTEGFRSQLVNARVGCDAPYSIQLINNLLTWYNSNEGVCTLVSTNIQDERNVRVLSRNVERANSFGIKGVLDYDEPLLGIRSADFENKYFLVFPDSGYCYVWDYEISPYRYSSSGETDPRTLAWFVFDRFYVRQFFELNKELLYVGGYSNPETTFTNKLIRLNNSFEDLPFDGNAAQPISSCYMTPFLQFGAVEYLKNVKNMYVQSRGDTSSRMNVYYYTDESMEPESDPETIVVGGRLWNNFHWETFQWTMVAWAKTFRRKCNLKKIEMASFYFENSVEHSDMCISHIGLQYQLVKYVR